jgi:small conductance mechanosensitive channel
MNDVLHVVKNLITVFGLKVIAAIAILIFGLWTAKIVKKLINKLLTKRNVDGVIVSFVANLTYAAVIVFIVIATLAQVGIQTTSFVAVIGAAGLAIGLALQGVLGNFAAGFLLIIFRPFKSGQFIIASGIMGTVEEIQLLYTRLKTPDNIKVVVPNGKLLADTITNYSLNDTRRAEWKIGVGYNDDLKKTREILQELIGNEKRILKDPAPQIYVTELGDSSVNFTVWAWTKSGDWWATFTDMIEKIKNRFDEEGINIPFPQRDVHLFQNS